jgi:ABC-2 type transport system permease protein
MLIATQGDRIVSDPVVAALIPVVIAGAWLITFLAMFMIGALGMFMDKSIAVFEVWWGMQAVLSGYLVPLALMPAWLRDIASWLPFRYMLEFPVQVMTGMTTRADALRDLAVQWGFVGLFLGGALLMWRTGVRRFEAFGG